MSREFKPVRTLACVVANYVPATNTKPRRIKVAIRDFPNKLYSENAPALANVDSRDVLQFAAQMRLDELGLDWIITGAGHIPNFGTVFTLKD
jgi:hypothetical protein